MTGKVRNRIERQKEGIIEPEYWPSEEMVTDMLMKSFSRMKLEYFQEKACEKPQTGGIVAQLAISLADPDEEVREEARRALSQLWKVLFTSRGIITKTGLFRQKENEQPWREGFAHLHTLGTMCRRYLSKGQQRACLKAAMEGAVNAGEPWLRMRSTFLVSSLLSQAQGLVNEQQEEILWEKLSRRATYLKDNTWQMEVLLDMPGLIQLEGGSRPTRSSGQRLPSLAVSSTASICPSGGTPKLQPVPPNGRPQKPFLPRLEPAIQPKPPAARPGSSLVGAYRGWFRLRYLLSPDSLPPTPPASPESEQ